MQTSVLFCMQGLVVWGRSLITAGHKPQKPSFFLPVLILSSCLNSANLESVKMSTSPSIFCWPKGKNSTQNFTPFLFL